jgi:hypothetical protein
MITIIIILTDFIKYFISDENLLLFPKFQQKITILTNLGYLQYETKLISKILLLLLLVREAHLPL